MSILDSDAFLDMPQSTQNLYMHMAMRADDDGFLGNPKKIMRMIGCQDDDYKLLIAKKFVIPFDSGICVIKHWLIHNTIRKDRYEETTYLEEKSSLNVAQNKAYSIGLPVGNQLATSGSHSIEQYSTVQNRTEQNKTTKGFDVFWSDYPKKVGKGAAEKSWKKLNPPLDVVMAALAVQKDSPQWTKDNGQFIPNPTTWLNQKRWEDEGVVITKESKFAKYDS